MDLLIKLVGAVSLLLWGIRLVRTGIHRAFKHRLRSLATRAAGSRSLTVLAGTGLAALMQSGTAVVTMAAALVNNRNIPLLAGLSLALGADLGTAIAAHFLNLELSDIYPVFFLASITVVLCSRRKQTRNIGRALFGLGLVLLSLSLIRSSAGTISDSDALAAMLQELSDDYALAILVGALFSALIHSSLAVVLLIAQLASEQAVSLPLALALILGANLGAGVPGVFATLGESVSGRRVAIGNLVMRVVGVLSLSWCPGILADSLTNTMQLQYSVLVIIAHLAFNLFLVAAFTPLLKFVETALVQTMRDAPRPTDDPAEPLYLLESDANVPTRALSNVVRETLRMAETVHTMLDDALAAFSDDQVIKRIKRLDDRVDTLHRAVTLYLANIAQERMDEEQSKRLFGAFGFATNLEHIGDIVDQNLMHLASAKLRSRVEFSTEGWNELLQLQKSLLSNYRLALDVFIRQDPSLAEALLAEKRHYRDRAFASVERHLGRLQQGDPAARASTSIHQDIIRDFRQINSHLSAVAYTLTVS